MVASQRMECEKPETTAVFLKRYQILRLCFVKKMGFDAPSWLTYMLSSMSLEV